MDDSLVVQSSFLAIQSVRSLVLTDQEVSCCALESKELDDRLDQERFLVAHVDAEATLALFEGCCHLHSSRHWVQHGPLKRMRSKADKPCNDTQNKYCEKKRSSFVMGRVSSVVLSCSSSQVNLFIQYSFRIGTIVGLPVG
jgi:hypothetical protein